jgi:hypothetical protein
MEKWLRLCDFVTLGLSLISITKIVISDYIQESIRYMEFQIEIVKGYWVKVSYGEFYQNCSDSLYRAYTKEWCGLKSE